MSSELRPGTRVIYQPGRKGTTALGRVVQCIGGVVRIRTESGKFVTRSIDKVTRAE